MSNKQETVADIVKELRGTKGGQHTNGGLTFERWRARCQLADDYADRFEAAHQREVAELRECLNEAIREKCPFTRMSCKHGEPCEYVCGTDKWRKALEVAKDEGK